jgi:hypothetical protein
LRLITVQERYERGQTFRLVPLGDIHLGSANCDTKALWDAVLDIKADPMARWIGMGDMVESIAPNDKRWQAGGIDEKIVNLASQDRIGDVYVEKVADILSHIAGQCWAYGDGNHEAKFNSCYYTNLGVRVLDAIGRPECYVGWSGITRVVFQTRHRERTALYVYHSHGWQAGRKDGAKVNGLDDLMGNIDGCHIYLQGHSHSRLVKTKTKLGWNPSFTKERAFTCFGAHTGSFLRTYQEGHSAYGERAGYPPVPIGPLEFRVTPTKAGVRIKAVQ